MSKFKAVMFDYDGTLMNTNNLIMGSWQHLFRTMTGKEGDPEVILKSFGETLEYSMTHLFPDEDPKRCMDIYREWQTTRYAEEIDLFPGMKELVVELKSRGYKLAMVSARMRKSMEDGLRIFGIYELFDAIVACDDDVAAKPDPEPAQRAMEKLGVRPEETVMLGDTDFDIGCANNAGVTSVLVGWSQSKANGTIVKYKPDYIIEEAKDLLEILED